MSSQRRMKTVLLERRAWSTVEVSEEVEGGPGSQQRGKLVREPLTQFRNWGRELAGFLCGIGLRRRAASTCLCTDEAHLGPRWLMHNFTEKFDITTQTIGEPTDLNREPQILNRSVRWNSRGLLVEAEPPFRSHRPSPCKPIDRSHGNLKKKSLSI